MYDSRERPITIKQRKRLIAIALGSGYQDLATVGGWIAQEYGYTNLDSIEIGHYEEICDKIEKKQLPIEVAKESAKFSGYQKDREGLPEGWYRLGKAYYHDNLNPAFTSLPSQEYLRAVLQKEIELGRDIPTDQDLHLSELPTRESLGFKTKPVV